jgi:TonB-dependent receptor
MRSRVALAPLLMGGACALALCAGAPAFAADDAAIATGTGADGTALAAQDDAAAKPASPGTVQEVVVTGVRRSLRDSANAKRASTDFTDSIFAEDIGKFPDLNLAEAVNRIPGVTINRDVDGEGVNISIRGLGTNFTKILLNGSQIAVASDGGLDNGNSNREVDLDMFPTELFTKLTVYKSSEAKLVEGGSSGVVDMVNARPFDNPGQHLTFTYQQAYNQNSDRLSPRGALIASKTWGDKFGVLLGVAGAVTHFRTDGFETIGWSTPRGYYKDANGNVVPLLPGCTAATCNTTNPGAAIGGAGWTFATSGPSTGGSIPGVTPGQPIDYGALDPGVTGAQLSNALMPRLGREVYDEGHRNRLSFLVSSEFRPTDSLKFTFDFLYGIAEREYNRLDMDWAVRNTGGSGPNSTGMVPEGVTVDNNGVVTSGKFYNSQFFLEARPYQEDLSFINFNPSMSWRVNDWIKVDGQFNYNQSVFTRETASYLFNSPFMTVDYSDTDASGIPQIKPEGNLNDPNSGWTWNRANIQNSKRVTHNLGTHWDATFGDAKNNIQVGAAYDDIYRKISAFDASTALQNCLTSGASATYVTPKLQQVTFTCPSPGVSTAQIPNYLTAGPAPNYFGNAGVTPGFGGFVQPNYAALNSVAPLSFYNQYAPFAGSSALNTPSGVIEEKTDGFYVQANGETEWLGHKIKFNAGGRYFRTDQIITGPVNIANQLETVTPVTISPGSAPVVGTPVQQSVTLTEFQTKDHVYDGFLPAFNVAADLIDNKLILRLAGSRTVTRPNPNAMLPGTTFADPAAQVANQGNPNLAPFYSNNFDIGLEYYTGGLGYVAFDEFNKSINGYTYNGSKTVPFSQLGIPLSALTPLQLSTGITNDTLITVNQQVNAPGTMIINGQELNYVQPLDFALKGLGFNANFTHVDWTTTGAGVPSPTGVPHFTYNLGAWYENYGLSLHVDYVWKDSSVAAIGPQNNVALNYYNDAYGQLDMSASYTLPWWGGRTQITFNALNMNQAVQRTYTGYERAAYSYYAPGSIYMVGFRGRF